MSKHKDKERSRDERRSRDRERSRDRDSRKRDRSKERNRHKKSKDHSKRSRSRKSSRKNRSRSRERLRRSRSRGSRRSYSHERERNRRNEETLPIQTNPKIDITPAQQAQITQFLSASLSGLSATQIIQPESIRTDFSNLFQGSTLTLPTVLPNSSAFAIAAAKAKDLLKNKNLTDNKNVSNDDSIASNGNESSHDAEEFFTALGSENSVTGVGDASNSEGDKKRKKKSRWASSNDGTEGKIFIPGMPTILPSNLNPDQQEAYLVQLQIEEISRKLRTGDFGISINPEERSPSPEPIYSSDGKRLNTREFRTRKKLEEQRHMLITRMQCVNPEFKPPADYKPPAIRVSDKVLIPQDEHPIINFVGLLIGPRGNTLKAMEKETGAKIIIRGKGSVKEGKVGRKDGQPLPGEDEPLHAFITASNLESVKKAVDKIKEVIKQGIEVPEGSNDLRRMQLRELAQLNGTLRETDGPRCTNCGSTDHKSWLCPDKPNVTNNIVCSSCGSAGHISKDCKQKRPGLGLGGVDGSNNQAKIDEEYMSLMAELGEVPPESQQQQPSVRETIQQSTRPYNIFDNQRHQQPRAILPAPPPPNQSNSLPPPMTSGPPPWHQNQHPPPSTQLHPISQQQSQTIHPMGQYPPPRWSIISNASIPPPPISSVPPPPPNLIDNSVMPPGIDAYNSLDMAPPGTISFFEDDRFGKKNPSTTGWPPINPPLPSGNYWGNNQDTLPPLPSFLAPPPPPPE